MTKTGTAVGPYRFAKLALPVINVFWHKCKRIIMFGILNLGHWDLFEIWFLVLGIFMIYIKQLTFLNSVNYLFKQPIPDNPA